MLNDWKRLGLSGRLRVIRGPSLMKVVLLRVGCISMTSLDSNKGFPKMFLLNFPRFVMIGFCNPKPQIAIKENSPS